MLYSVTFGNLLSQPSKNSLFRMPEVAQSTEPLKNRFTLISTLLVLVD